MKRLLKIFIAVAVAVGLAHAIRDARIAHRRHGAEFAWTGFDDDDAAEESRGPTHKIMIQHPPRPPRPPRAPRAPRPPRPPQVLVVEHENQAAQEPVANVSVVDPVTVAKLAEAEVIQPPAWFTEDEADLRHSAPVGGLRTIKSAQKGDEKRAEADARLELNRAVATWLAPEVPRSWAVPRNLLESLIIDRHNESVMHDYGELFVQGYRVDFSTPRRERIVQIYHRQFVHKRLLELGGGLGFVLVCLAALSGYIRADEATKGYYTNRLRLLAAAAVGGAGVMCYQLLSHNV
jgi:hypothetical protein